ncbi:MAG: type II secretion system minor pseudopilin GspJ [Gammaproteobacteria bacterium]
MISLLAWSLPGQRNPVVVRRCVYGQAGFTLLELLVAMGIFALIGVMALGGLNNIVNQSTMAGQQDERLASLQRALRIIALDLGSADPRYVRDELGDRKELPFLAEGRGDYLVRLTRGGWANPAQLPYRGTLQRVQYRLEDGKLLREYWPVLDRVLGLEPRQEELLTGVEDVKLLFLDTSSGAPEWQQQWPPLRNSTGAAAGRPRAVQVTLELEDWGEVERLIEVVP